MKSIKISQENTPKQKIYTNGMDRLSGQLMVAEDQAGSRMDPGYLVDFVSGRVHELTVIQINKYMYIYIYSPLHL